MKEILPGLYILRRDRLATSPPSQEPLYGEKIVDGLRVWDPRRSKLAALLLRYPCLEGVVPSGKVLYLGAANGTTVSYLSDILTGGMIYAVEISPRAMRDLLLLAEQRENIIPVLGDAARPETYRRIVEPVDLLYQDVAQRNQAEIASRNASIYLKPNGLMVVMIKARSIDSTARSTEIFDEEIRRLSGVEVLRRVDLPHHRDHVAVVTRKLR
ncbi:MAG: fibrillarin-like rRNA/tRNA 2'-O-methyltransferase [Methanothrix sp.]|jgi:Fibrillarin-like rRNA methylase|uniref:fibrillarin-like rRNA/tRNA 2'-O-methyltransferase n=1 Tax=Methanothrix sp. TaxID=90426 RepID=UPI001999CFCE|nr:fibrillarin-like rRNA/tRNA 2'-O-methyltransferase [Methanothrix sp.]MBC7079553.1 fibrillarin-like rRNA/tRNA 2'-O-methyltransferase [Methanothrix sp.]NPU87524.1 fibrillarin-like rRNA/tRNA 2'-O-methyltransferase [Methanothrix sp.]